MVNTDMVKAEINRKDITEGVRQKALAEIDVIVDDPKADFVPDRCLRAAFTWNETPSRHGFWKNINDAPNKSEPEVTAIRTFDTGATRSSDVDKIDYEGFFSPHVLIRYAEYLHKHRVQADGELRDSDNWQQGIPIKEYMKSKWRHFMGTWAAYRQAIANGCTVEDIEESLCAELFNTMGMLHEILKEKND